MDTNPYSPPLADGETSAQDATIEYRVFGTRLVSFRLTSTNYRDATRREVQQAISEEFGADNVVSITEHSGLFEAFTVVVWYRVQHQI